MKLMIILIIQILNLLLVILFYISKLYLFYYFYSEKKAVIIYGQFLGKGIIESLIIVIVASIIETILRIIGLKCKYKQLYETSKFIHNRF